MEIISLQNPKVKEVNKLQQSSSYRKEQGLYVLEGVREFSLAQRSGYKPHMVFICSQIYLDDPNYPIYLSNVSVGSLFYVSPEVYKKIAYRDGVEGIVGVFHMKRLDLESIAFTSNPLFLVLEKVEKPGNLGAIFRTADAAGVSAVFLCDMACDPYNPNAIRSSLGCIFTVPWLQVSNSDLLHWLKTKSINVVSSTPIAQKSHFHANLNLPCAIVMGAEDKGLSPFWLTNAHETIVIPMQGEIDSLNVSVATAILLFEALRQRLEAR